MNIALLLEMAASGDPDRAAVVDGTRRLTYAELHRRAAAVAERLTGLGVADVALLDVNSAAVPILLFASALAGCRFTPLNYRLTDEALEQLVDRLGHCAVVVGDGATGRLAASRGRSLLAREEVLGAESAGVVPASAPGDADGIAVSLFTSGTTAEPKQALLRHRHLSSYILSTVEFLGASPDDAALVAVPPYHIAGIAAALSSVYAGRRVVYLPQFTPEAWVDTARSEGITHAMVVPTMLARIVDHLAERGLELPALRHLAYGGGRMPVPVLERAMALLPGAGFVNAYGLTETSSTIAVLGPDDHRAAVTSADPVVRARLGSVGRPVASVELSIRDEDGRPLPAGARGEIWVRGEQVAGQYAGRSALNDEGWFPTSDAGRTDDDGYLFVEGRLDDVIVRGGENLSPGEIEDVLLDHPAVAEVGVAGIPSDQWGEAVAAAVVLRPGTAATAEGLQQWVRDHLRSSKVPEIVLFCDALPYTDTGKLQRRALREYVAAG